MEAIAPDMDALYGFVRSDPELNKLFRRKAISEARKVVTAMFDGSDELADGPIELELSEAPEQKPKKRAQSHSKIPYSEVCKLIMKSIGKGSTVYNMAQKPAFKKQSIETLAVRSCMYKLETQGYVKRDKKTVIGTNGRETTVWVRA